MTRPSSRRSFHRAAVAALLVCGSSLPWLAHAVVPNPANARAAALVQRTTDQPTQQLIIKYRAGTPRSAAATTAQRAALHRLAQDVVLRAGHALTFRRVGAMDLHVMRLERALPLAEVRRLAQQIQASDPAVEYAEPDRRVFTALIPNDTDFGQQWHFYEPIGSIRLPPAWDRATGRGVVAAVVDTGYRPHTDLVANVLPGYDFIDDITVSNDGDGRDGDAQDPGDWIDAGECGVPSDVASSWHGTHVAGTIAAVTNNSKGVAGVAFDAKVLPVRVLGKCGGSFSDVIDGIVWAAGGMVSGVPDNPRPAQVINVSLGGFGACDLSVQNAIDLARSRGAVVVAAAGNSSSDASSFSPANCDRVIAVAATNRRGGIAWYSNFGDVVDVAAPGGDIRDTDANGVYSTLDSGLKQPVGDAYGHYQGTSMAAPHVTGVVALVQSVNRALTPDQVTGIVTRTARPPNMPCVGCGAGLVDALAAVEAATEGDPPPVGTPERERNDSFAQAQPLAAGETILATIDWAGDRDFFKAVVPAGAPLRILMAPNAAADYDVVIYDSQRRIVKRSKLGKGLTEDVTVTNDSQAPAEFYVLVYRWNGVVGSRGTYTLTRP